MRAREPLATAIAVCFNHSRFVRESLYSIRDQTYKNVQLIIIDDCSTDNSAVVIQDWISSNSVDCLFLRQPENKGVCNSLNTALAHANGSYISLLATDDIWLPTKLEHQITLMETLPDDVGVIYSDAYQIDEKGNLLPKMFLEAHRDFIDAPQGNIFAPLLEANFIPGMTTLIRRPVYDKVGLYDQRLPYEDWDMWLRIARYYKFMFSQFISAKYRIVSTSLMRTALSPGNSARHVAGVLVLSKVLAVGGVSKEQARMLRINIRNSARTLYWRHDTAAIRCLSHAVRHAPDLATLLLLALAVCRVPPEWIRKRVAFIGKCKGYIRWRYSDIRERLTRAFR